ncbi:MAG: S-layer homology domain-containing protein [Clostridia bacterium]|nr:S-layer homology domain-containing protein [Clostridia bacterium]
MTKSVLRRTAAILAAVLLALPVSAARTYTGQFTDVASGAWYYNDIADAYASGLINGKSDTQFKPDGTLTIAETIKLAVCCHQMLRDGSVTDLASSGGNWYDPYVSYATENGIVTEVYDDYNAPATRGQVAVLFSRTMISSGTEAPEVNPIAFGQLTDVDVNAWYSGSVYRLYRWGILTGDGAGSVKPEAQVKRSEISAIVMRMIDASKRVDLNANDGDRLPETPAVTIPSDSTSTGTTTGSADAPDVLSSLTLYGGSTDKKAFSGITGAAGDFSIAAGESYLNASYSMDLLNSVILENDNISFRLYTGSGYEALGIVRGWLNDAARGYNGSSVRERNDVYAAINSLFKIWIDDTRIPVNEMWYADHGDYTTYAFYFDRYVDPDAISSVRFLCGRVDADTLDAYGMESLGYLAANAEELTTPPVEESLGNLGETPSDDTPGQIVTSENYDAAIRDAKQGAEILYEYETARCTILYGRRMYGGTVDDYRLLFIFPDGTVQNVAYVKLDSIRINNDGDVLYYAIEGPDGKMIQYGVNLGGR